MVYGTWTGAIKESDPTNPIDYYGKCKLKSETFCTENDIIITPELIRVTRERLFQLKPILRLTMGK